MTLNSFNFIVFFSLALLVLVLLQFFCKANKEKWEELCQKLQVTVLLIASYVFVAFSDLRFLGCILLLTIITYYLAICIEKFKKRIFLLLGVLTCLSMLGYFKYFDFFVGGFARTFGLIDDHFAIILPLGISFYTFSAISYLIDIKRNKYPAEKNILYYALYMSFFPKIISGPIIRANDFLPKVRKYRGIKADSFLCGIQIFVIGLFKKIVLADHLGVFVNEVFSAPTAFNTPTVILAVLSYTLQIYFDFSGYSDMAIGLSKILGFDFDRNFNMPLVSRSISEYWRRWHITLGTWFKDYLYYPLSIGPAVKLRKRLVKLGVDRKMTAVLASAFSLLIVWLSTGLWHGANWTFIIWGLIQFVFVFTDSLRHPKKENTKWRIVCSWFITFFIIVMGKVVFRANSISDALIVYKTIFVWQDGISHPYTWTFFSIGVLIIATIMAYLHSRRAGEKEINSYYPLLDLSNLWQLTLFFAVCGITIIMGYYGDTTFIYAKF